MKTLHETITQFLRATLKPARFCHSIGTAKVAVILANRYNIDIKEAALAALLHDAGKGYDAAGMVRYACAHNLKAPCLAGIIKYNPLLLHSYISAHIARTKFNVKNRKVLAAIAQHTLGGPRMTTLAKILYIADIIAPDRRFTAVHQLRRLAMRDLERAMRAAQEIKLTMVIGKNAWIHPQAVATWNETI